MCSLSKASTRSGQPGGVAILEFQGSMGLKPLRAKLAVKSPDAAAHCGVLPRVCADVS